MSRVDDLRVRKIRPLLPPAVLIEEIPLTQLAADRVAAARTEIGNVVQGLDRRLLVVVGPCSIHDPAAGLEFARRLRTVRDRLSDDLLIVMRTYFEKPRTTVGWKGLINDPNLDGSFAINKGLRVARQFLLDVVETGLPTGTEFLDPISPQFLADVICWGAIGARTSESQVHRELASGLSMPVGFKNGTGGSIQIAVDALRSSAQPHSFLSVTKEGLAAIVETTGNPVTHLILRGGGGRGNYDSSSVESAVGELVAAGVNPRLMVDCSHANSGKDPQRQMIVADAVAAQRANGQAGVMGVMLEGFLVEGNQPLQPGRALTYGQSVTDACLSFEGTERVLEALAAAAARMR